MTRNWFHMLFLAAATLVTVACEKTVRDQQEDELVPVQLALRVGMHDKATKGYPAYITEMDESFRGMTGIIVLPFGRYGTVLPGDKSVFHPSLLSNISDLLSGSHAHLFPSDEAFFPNGTASVLAYGYAPTTATQMPERLRNHINGVLTANGLETMSSMRATSDITFSHEPIHPGPIPEEAQQIADILNSIVQNVSFSVDYTYEAYSVLREGTATVTWNESIDDTHLRDAFRWVTNGGARFPGSGTNVQYMISQLQSALESYESLDNTVYRHSRGSDTYEVERQDEESGSRVPLTHAYLYNGLRDAILARIAALVPGYLTGHLTAYPQDYGLPSGAAILLWTGTSYRAVKESMDGVASLSSFCYPPRLWYYTNTTISTAASEKSSAYLSASNWNDILTEYDGKAVYGSTKSVALDNPMQFACGMMLASVRATSDAILDHNGNTVIIEGDKFPVTGVIVGSQQRLAFDFTPTGEDEYFLYDDCISGVYLNYHAAGADDIPSFRTLVSQTPDGEDVYFCLELRNDSGQTFVGADGNIFPGGKFYLLGRIVLPESGDNLPDAVFLRDQKTRINCAIASFSEARNAIPDLLLPQLSFGLQVTANWSGSTPANVVLY